VHIVAKKTVDHDIMDALETKGDVAAFVVDRIVSPLYDEDEDVMMVKYRK
jgi:hypothetical protein